MARGASASGALRQTFPPRVSDWTRGYSAHARSHSGLPCCTGAAVFSREVTGTAGYIEVLMYHIDNREYIGRWSNDPTDGVRDVAVDTLATHLESARSHPALIWPCADFGAVVVQRGTPGQYRAVG